MARSSSLRQRARRLGIETGHIDVFGLQHEVADTTLAAVIAAFGPSAKPYRSSVRRRVDAFGLAPVQIVRVEDPEPALALDLPDGVTAVDWTCRCEDGRVVSGRSALDRPRLTLPADLPLGYHTLAVEAGGAVAEISLIVTPVQCYLPPGLMPGARAWGGTAQLYGLRSQRNWGIGDFTDLAALARGAGAVGAAVVGFNPLHALFAAEPRHVSPYSPSSRSFLDYLYIDVTAVPGFADDPAARDLAADERLAAVRAAPLVDHEAVALLKRPVLEALFRSFRARDLDAERRPVTALGAAFCAFRDSVGAALAGFARFEALHEHFSGTGGDFSWHSWPAAMRDPGSPEVAQFARDHADRVAFFEFLQWEADRQLAAAAASGQAGGLAIGLYRDLAVGVDPHGASAWADQGLVVPGAAIGAPPDLLNRSGQNWGLAPVNPVVLRQRGFAPFIASLRANMRHAGLLRLDHVMALRRLYWVPHGSDPTAGAYVNYPLAELLRLIALESHRQRCAVIGEDLGTVPDGFRETMQAANVLSYRVVPFERRADRSFVPPGDYPALAAASGSTHDLATIKGFWLGCDLAWRCRLGLYPDAAAEASEAADRSGDRRLLLDALVAEGLLGAKRCDAFLSPDGVPRYAPELGEAIIAFLARARSRLMLVQLEDIAGESEQANLPGTTDAHPNWRRRMAQTLDELLAGGEWRRVARLIGEGRRRSAAS